MTKTYDRTMFITNEELQKTTIRLYVSEGCKYLARGEEEEKEITYTGLTRWSIVSSDDAAEIERDLSEEEKDEFNEYLVLEFNDGTTATFRNSHVDMFIR